MFGRLALAYLEKVGEIVADITVNKEQFTAVFNETITSLYIFAKSFVIDFCGLTFTLWDVFIAGMVLGVFAVIYWMLAE